MYTIRQRLEVFGNTCWAVYFPGEVKSVPPHGPEIKTLVTLLLPTSRAAIRQTTDAANYKKGQEAEEKNWSQIIKTYMRRAASHFWIPIHPAASYGN